MCQHAARSALHELIVELPLGIFSESCAGGSNQCKVLYLEGEKQSKPARLEVSSGGLASQFV
jgi:hypothetical protein